MPAWHDPCHRPLCLNPMSAYPLLLTLANEIALLESTAATLGWDQETYMPPKALEHRAQQMGYLGGKGHALFTSKKFRLLLDKAETEELPPIPAANVREWRRLINRAVRLSQKLVEEFSIASSRAKAAWVEARRHSDFAQFAPHLDKLLQLTRRKSEKWGYATEPYDALLDEFEPGAKAVQISTLFDSLRPQLSALAREAVARGTQIPADALEGDYPIALQQQLNSEVAASIGFDFEGGRIDTTAHPFCTKLGPHDQRLTTRYDKTDFTSSLFGILHEAGHGLYEQGLPADSYGLPAGTAVSLGIHESQSRLWENHVGRSRPFWERWLPRAKEIFPGLKLSLEEFLRVLYRADFSFIRVEADEATYDLHILLRFMLERRLLNQELKVKDLPKAWNDQFEDLFGLTPPDDARGCLQDIHWSMGALGYFPTYTLGNLNAAQLYHAAQKVPAISQACAKADYAPLLDWLRKHVHSKGSSVTSNDLMAAATGATTDPSWHLGHLRARFLG
ncbi:MAG: Thermostable carboxypeptidase 1 [Verrucomicrobiaceae bacterium]|nr:Thermostable carboxypeptidase 1 [Verrucomicrobiaceae bacterium]